MVPIAQPGAIVRGEDNQRILVDVVSFQCLQDLPDGPIHLHDDITEQASLACPAKLVRNVKGNVNH